MGDQIQVEYRIALYHKVACPRKASGATRSPSLRIGLTSDSQSVPSIFFTTFPHVNVFKKSPHQGIGGITPSCSPTAGKQEFNPTWERRLVLIYCSKRNQPIFLLEEQIRLRSGHDCCRTNHVSTRISARIFNQILARTKIESTKH